MQKRENPLMSGFMQILKTPGASPFPPEAAEWLEPVLATLIPELEAIMADIEAQASARLQQKLQENPELNKEEEKAKMELRKTKKFMEIIIPRVLEAMKEAPPISPDVRLKMKLPQGNREEFSKEMLKKGVAATSKLYKRQLQSPESGFSQYVDFAASSLTRVLETEVFKKLREDVQTDPGGAGKFITKIITERIQVESLRAHVTKETESFLSNPGSKVYTAIRLAGQGLDELLRREVSQKDFFDFLGKVEFKIHRALELDAPELFALLDDSDEQESSVRANNRYFTSWSEQEHEEQVEREHSKGFF